MFWTVLVNDAELRGLYLSHSSANDRIVAERTAVRRRNNGTQQATVPDVSATLKRRLVRRR